MGMPDPSTTHTWEFCRPLQASVSSSVQAFVTRFPPSALSLRMNVELLVQPQLWVA